MNFIIFNETIQKLLILLDFNLFSEFGDCPNITEWQKHTNDCPNVPDSILSQKKRLRDSSPLKNSLNCEEPTIWTNPSILKSHDGQLTTVPSKRNSRNLKSHRMHKITNDTKREEEFMKIRERKSREKMSPRIPVERSSAINAAIKKSKISRPTLLNANSLRVQSAAPYVFRAFVNERILNVFPIGESKIF